MSRSKDIDGEVHLTHEGGSEKSPPLGGGDALKPTSPTGSKSDELTSEVKVLMLQEKIAKLKKKLKSKKIKVQEVSSSSSNEQGNDSSSDDKSSSQERQ
jgi:hypothetical protein